MAINFPNSPSTNDTHTVGDKTWTWNATYWHLNQNSSTYYAQDGVPSNPDGGDFWFESDTGQLFVRYDSAWVEIGHATDFGSSMSDADGDTLIQLEEGSDEDIIRFDTGGTERMTIAANGAVNVGGTLTAGAFSGPLTGNVTGNASGTALTVTQAAQSAITSVGTLTGLTVSGDLTVDGTTTTINSTTLTVDDKNIELGSVASPSDTTADGGGITLKGASDKTILWTNSTDTWDFNQGITVTGTATATAFAGPLTGNVTGNTSGSSGSSTGNAATATALATARTINGVSFDGTGNITVTAAAGTLSGSTLASGVTASSLTSVGTLTLLSFANAVGNKIDFYHSTGGSGDRYGIQVQSNELRIHCGATAKTTFGSSTTGTFTERMRITNAGNVGIADSTIHSYTTWGAPKLQVHGPVHIKNWTGTPASSTEVLDWPHSLLHMTTKSNYPWARLQSWGYSNDAPYNTTFDAMWNLGIYQNSTNNLSVSNSGTDLKFAGPGAFAIRAGGAERFLITNTGNVGIGTTSPAAPLQVNTTASDAATIQMNTTHATSKRCRLQFAYGGTQGWEWGTDINANGGTELYAYNRAQNVIAMTVLDTGNVGIGTTTPTAPLHLFGAGDGVDQLKISSTGGTVSEYGFLGANASTNSMRYGYWTGGGYGTHHFEGWVMVGKSSHDGKALEVYQASNTGIRLQNATTSTGTGAGLLLEAGGSDVHIWNYSNGYMRFGTNNTERMRILASGNVGIGTTTPSYLLHVNGYARTGNLRVISSSEGWSEGIRIVTAVNNWGGVRWKRTDAATAETGNWYLGYQNNSTHDLVFGCYNGSAQIDNILYLKNSTGYVGIRNGAPVLPLDVAGGDATSQGAIIRQRLMVRHVDGKSWNDAGLANSGALYFNYGRSSACYINWTGSGSTYVREEALTGSTMVMTGGKVGYTTSRAALKDNVRNVTGAVDLVKRMRPVRFNFKPSAIGDGTNEMVAYDERVGFIAEEMADISHEFATWAWFGDDDKPLMVDPEMNEDGTGGSYLDGPSQPPLEEAEPIGWESGAVASVTVAALKELIARVETLESA